MKLSVFKKIVHQIVRDANGEVIDVFAPGPTPNFFAANVSLQAHGSFAVLCSLEGNWAFSRPYDEGVCELSFVDCEPLASALRDAYEIDPISESALNQAFKKQSFHEDSDIRYWKPKSLGEGLFNWWD